MVTIQTANGEVRLRSDDVEELTISPQSMMPDGLLDKLNDDQTRDLIAWLMGDGVDPNATRWVADAESGD